VLVVGSFEKNKVQIRIHLFLFVSTGDIGAGRRVLEKNLFSILEDQFVGGPAFQTIKLVWPNGRWHFRHCYATPPF
jgi:hypothetical protein